MKKSLTSDEIRELAFRVAEPTFKFMKKKINAELKTFISQGNFTTIEPNHLVNLMIVALSSLDSNMLIMTRNSFKHATGNEIDFVKMMTLYMNDLMSIMNVDEQARLREKLN